MGLRQVFGIDDDEFEQMAAKQDYRCAICKLHVPLVIDHDHRNWTLRGLLCLHCNCGIGHFRENPELFASALAYLDYWIKHPGPERRRMKVGSKEFRDHIKKALTGRVRTDEQKLKMKWTPERHARMAEVRKNSEYNAKISAGVKAAWQRPEYRQKHMKRIDENEEK